MRTVTNRRLEVHFVDDYNPPADAVAYLLHVQVAGRPDLRVAARVAQPARNASVLFPDTFPTTGRVAVSVSLATIFEDYGHESGLSEATFTTRAVALPSCGNGCLECTASACLSCNNNTGFFLPPNGTACRGGAASSASSGVCLDLGSELCDAPLFLALIAMIVLFLFLAFAVVLCCTHRRVVMKEHEEALVDVYIRDAKFVPRWTQRDAKYR